MDLLLCGSFDSEERDAWLVELQRAMPDARWHLHAPTQNAERIVAAVVANPPPGSLQGLPGLRLIQSLWAGVDRLLDDPSLPEVPLARMVDPAMSAAMAETALWATLSLHRRFFDYAQQQRDRHWYPLPQRRADEIEIAVLGMGQMGRTCARRLLETGYRVTGWNQHGGAIAGMALEHGLEALWPLLARLLPLKSGLPYRPGIALPNRRAERRPKRRMSRPPTAETTAECGDTGSFPATPRAAAPATGLRPMFLSTSPDSSPSSVASTRTRTSSSSRS